MNKLTLVVPCYQRPQRTIRALESVIAQDMHGWEAYFIGDGCPEFQKLLDDGVFDSFKSKAKENGNTLHTYNLEHEGFWGYNVRNHIISKAESKYTLFLDNDDVLKPNHFTNYYNGINNSLCDFVYFDTYIEPTNTTRNCRAAYGWIGLSEIIAKTELLKKMPPMQNFYGHDWTLIENMIRSGATHTKIETEPTYIIKGVGDFRNDTIN